VFAWDDYLQLAEELHESDSTSVTEARERTATSRAYYAAFHRALEHAPKRIKTAQRDKHRKLIDHYKKGYTETERAVGRKLKMLRDNRNAADYDADIGGAGQSVFKAGESIHLCKEICSALADLH
jgi:uncharacterized protein (UPF0332 family)